MADPKLAAHIEAVRRFNRFYTRQIGVLQEGYLDSPFSLTEVRVLYELARRDACSASELAGDLGLDPGYLSRLLQGFRRRGLLERRTSGLDRRRSELALTKRGRAAFAALDERTNAGLLALLARLGDPERERLAAAMAAIEATLAPETDRTVSFVLREPRPGDLGWVVHRHGALYAQEHGYDDHFEALVTDVVAKFARHHDPARERGWIAERDGAIVGSVFLVQKSTQVAQLRLLLVEPSARGRGLGTRLVDECVRFARKAGYRKIVLYTHDTLHAARHVYQRAGFELLEEEPETTFGPKLMGQTWALDLAAPRQVPLRAR
ncbi:MAG TPA: helix-turn-helix domain-containing GNAT family N-acetyltransferase [Candidatus Thermoplasmatota archaeon]|nr:helix-turn-helix domain-containing GNAT family N-acetyltransferase [Candidatus Thermoplasmatota archaeon]